MKTDASLRILKLATLAITIACGLSVRSAQAYEVTLDQVGLNVVATGTGAIDLTGLTFLGSGTANGGLQPNIAQIVTGPTTVEPFDAYTGFTGPTSFGPGGLLTQADSGTGDMVGVNGNPATFGVPLLAAPSGYISGGLLSDTSTYNNATFASLGVTPGTYVWTWGTGVNQNFTLQIGPASVPDSGTSFGLLVGALGALSVVRRFRPCPSA